LHGLWLVFLSYFVRNAAIRLRQIVFAGIIDRNVFNDWIGLKVKYGGFMEKI